MARKAQLKVFRTPIGFHDAYVAAPSQKAALEAWGADSNLFATGSAELVVEAKLTKEPLSNPGTIIKLLRGTLDEHVAALPKPASKASAKPTPTAPTAKPRKMRPRPKRDTLDRAEVQLTELEAAHAQVAAELDQRQAALDQERRRVEAKQASERQKARKRVTAARERYETEMEQWRAE